VDPKRQSLSEAGAYLLVRDGLAELRAAARTLTVVEETAPDPERARHLTAIRTAIAQLDLDLLVTPPTQT